MLKQAYEWEIDQRRQSEERYRAIFENIQDVYFEISLPGIIEEISPSISLISHFTREELLGTSLYHYYSDPAIRERLLDKLRAQERVTDYEIMLKDKDGSFVPCSITARLLREKNDETAKIVGTMRNISERYQFVESLKKSRIELEQRVVGRTAELADANRKIMQELLERRRAEKELRASEERYRAIVEDQTELICRFLPNGILTFVNEAYCRYFNRRREELIGASFMPRILEEDREKITHLSEPVTADSVVCVVEHRVILDNGDIRWQQWTDRKIFDDSGRFIEFQSVGRDITEQRGAEEALKRAKEELERQNQELKKIDKIKDGLLRDVAHELKTPVAKQVMQLELAKEMLDESGLAGKFGNVLRIMDESIKRQINVINNILDLSRLEEGGRKYKCEPVALDGLVRDVLAYFNPEITVHQIALSEELTPLVIRSDKEMLFHVFSNIVNNAIKYRSREAAPRIHAGVTLQSATARVIIEDNGLGLAPENVERVFDRFYQVSASADGTGVGLTIAKIITEDLRGKIWVESDGRGKGTRVFVQMPLQ
ncbi:MAG: hypothetical protein A2519_01335 [Candidatus Raymondbacteria bacterium RIFOXYD12_FULL_49_13]|uniref:histidine kinase n=1 Tax=Candidatus Raymondbacteria bacterium RIFOXYD12_FULL_49_13 TaxID=1817890 RepID=A0A1F7F3A3_UNCRA|nr:MAG: hypothetical protein A2519_01335 [Candidatus Raymondbacteria bacterium RIFOXYD12_FULL_49_13]